MGLGKTVQTLGLLTALRKEQGFAKTSLVVCPATLLENWKREAKRFCPDYSVLVHHGPDRAGESAALGKPDLVVTSYGTLVRDLELFEPIPFLCVIGDEAQHLKNRKTRTPKPCPPSPRTVGSCSPAPQSRTACPTFSPCLNFSFPEPDPSSLPPPAETNAFGTNNASSRKPPPTSCAAENGSRARTPRKDRTSSLPRPDGGTSRLLRRSPGSAETELDKWPMRERAKARCA